MDQYQGLDRSIIQINSLIPPINNNPGRESAVGRTRQRLITKDGDINFRRICISDRSRYLEDVFTSLLDLPWIWILFLFVFCFVTSWLLFAAIWYAVMVNHGDFSQSVFNGTDQNFVPCVVGVKSFIGALLYSIETQQTIGYGTRAVTEQCRVGVFILILQSWFGLIIQAVWVGLVYTRLSRPQQRRRTLLWSENAVISLRDGILTLQCRLGDMRYKSTLVEAHVRMYYLSKRKTKENETIPLSIVDMDVGYDMGRDRIFLNWPLIIEHKINEKSPLYQMDNQSICLEHFEILVVLEGVVEPSGMVTQAKTSYLPREIFWGSRFERMIHFEKDQYTVDYSKFNKLIKDSSTPDCSAKQLEQENNN